MKEIVTSMRRELTGSCSYPTFQVSWHPISGIDHQKQHKCKNYSSKNITNTDLLVLMIILTMYSTIAHIVLFSKYILCLDRKNKPTIANK